MGNNIIQCPHCTKPVAVPQPELPKEFDSICQQFPQLCHQVNELQVGLGRKVDLMASAMNKFLENQGSHPKPTREFIEENWKNCPECKAAYDRLLRENPSLFEPTEVKEESWWNRH